MTRTCCREIHPEILELEISLTATSHGVNVSVSMWVFNKQETATAANITWTGYDITRIIHQSYACTNENILSLINKSGHKGQNCQKENGTICSCYWAGQVRIYIRPENKYYSNPQLVKSPFERKIKAKKQKQRQVTVHSQKKY